MFVVHTGTWAFRTGVDAEDGEVILTAGDVISLPTSIFRGFENVGDDNGFLYAILGEDDPGRVLWAPQVFDLAKDHGLILLENGSLLDQHAGETLTRRSNSDAQDDHPNRWQSTRLWILNAAEKIVIRKSNFNWSSSTALSESGGVQEVALLGPASRAESVPVGHLGWSHGFSLRALNLSPGARVPAHRRREEEVIFVQKGSCRIDVDGESLELNPGDTFTTPINASRSFTNEGDENCVVYLTRRGDQPEAPDFI